MTVTRFTPLSDVAALQNRLNSIFQTAEGGQAGSFVPAVDIYEDAQKLALTFELPGINPQAVDVRVENNVLTVKGERTAVAEQKEGNFRRVERRFGSFTRSFTLPQSVDTEQVTAQSENGVLVIEVPKKAAAQPKQIKVSVAASSVDVKENQPVSTEQKAA